MYLAKFIHENLLDRDLLIRGLLCEIEFLIHSLKHALISKHYFSSVLSKQGRDFIKMLEEMPLGCEEEMKLNWLISSCCYNNLPPE